MIPVGTSVNPGELRSGPKWEKTFILYPQPPTLSLESTFTHVHWGKIISPSISCWMMSSKYWPIQICFYMGKGATRHQENVQQSYHCENIINSGSLMLIDALTTLNTCFVPSMQLRLNR